MNNMASLRNTFSYVFLVFVVVFKCDCKMEGSNCTMETGLKQWHCPEGFESQRNVLNPTCVGYHVRGGPQSVERKRYISEVDDPIKEATEQMGYEFVDANGFTQSEFYDYQDTLRKGQRCSTAKAYLVPAENRTNLDIVSNAFVTKIPVIQDLPVGDNLQDHMEVPLLFYIDHSIPNKLEKITDPLNIKEYIESKKGEMFEKETSSLAASCLIIITTVLYFYWYSRRNHDYWKIRIGKSEKIRKSSFEKPAPFFGSTLKMLKTERAHQRNGMDWNGSSKETGQPKVETLPPSPVERRTKEAEGKIADPNLGSYGEGGVKMKSGIENVEFKNWAETFDCKPELFFAPKTQEEVSQILEVARDEHKKVRVVGCRHSPSDIACTSGFMISLLHFNKILEIDKIKRQVKVQAGMTLSDLNDSIYSHNLALPVQGSISSISVGGAISVATHGSGAEFGSISSYVTEMDLMLSNGSILTVSPDKDSDLFQAALCSLGSFGIILNATFQCEPACNLLLRQYGLPLKDVIENLDVHISGSDHFRFMWFPYTDNVVVSHATRTELPATKDTWYRKIWSYCWDLGIGYHLLELCYYLSTYLPHMVPYINRFFYMANSTFSRKIDRSYRILNYDCLFKQYVNEWAIPVEKTGVVLWQLREWVETTPDFYAHFPVEVRFAKADNIFLSPAFGRNTCYINVVMYRPYGKDVPYQEFFQAFERIMMEAGGRPHWAKAHSVTSEGFKQMYPFFGKWCLIRQKLDPIHMFMNPYMSRILR